MKIRFDKSWNDALTKEGLDEMLNEVEFTKTMKKKQDGDESEDDDDAVE